MVKDQIASFMKINKAQFNGSNYCSSFFQFGTLSDFILVDSGLYRGDVRYLNKINKRCILKWTSCHVFRSGNPHGEGTITYFTDDPGDRYNYTGEWNRGVRQGFGATAFRDGRLYAGRYADNKENGRGTVRY